MSKPSPTAPAREEAGAERLAPAMLNQLARYAPALRLIEGRPEEEASLLEVGSGSEGIARFASGRWEITVCDRDFSDYGSLQLDGSTPTDGRLRRVEGDVTALRFEDGQFDVVLALDLLEHIPPDLRARALSELARVSSGILIVGCPCGQDALDSDRRLARFYRLQGRTPPPWLLEHLENGFPDVGEMRAALEPYGTVKTFPNERVGFHEVVSMFEGVRGVVRATVWLARRLEAGMYAEAGGRTTVAARALRVLRGWDSDPAYRQFAVLERPVATQR